MSSYNGVETVDVEEVSAIASGARVNHINKIHAALVHKDEKSVPKVHISEQPFTLSNWHQHINWLNTTLIFIIPVIGFLSIPFVPLQKKTAWWSFIYYYISGLGITAGYHRLFSHRSYKATAPLRLFYALIGGSAAEGSIKWWSNGHRTHHRFTDTDKDPYNARWGFFFSHMGWMMFNQNPKLKGRTDISDLNADPIVRFQHKYYIYVLIFMAYIFPTLVAGYGWGDWKGGFLYSGILRLCLVHQSTFCVNSLAHWIGEQPFDDKRTPRDHVLTAFATLGEGYHNFHHEFPSDYRNALKWYQYDPTKVVIWITKQLGLAYDLQTFSQNAIEQGLVQQKQKKLDRWRSRLNWGIPIEQLPVIEFDDFKAQAKERKLVLISGIVHDVHDFVEKHPGGKALISSAIGKDGTAVFNGGVYAHSNAAHNLLATMRVAVLRGGCEVEVWKQAQTEKKDVNLVSDSISGGKIVRAGQQATRTGGAGISGRAA